VWFEIKYRKYFSDKICSFTCILGFSNSYYEVHFLIKPMVSSRFIIDYLMCIPQLQLLCSSSCVIAFKIFVQPKGYDMKKMDNFGILVLFRKGLMGINASSNII